MSVKQVDLVALHQENLHRAIEFVKFAEAKKRGCNSFCLGVDYYNTPDLRRRF